MECWYDSLFECDCEGIAELIKVPCAGNVYTTFYQRLPSGQISSSIDSFDPKLEKRIKWIASCAGAFGFSIIAIDDWRVKRWKIFIQVADAVFYPDPKDPWRWVVRGFGTKTIKVVPDPDFPWNYTLIEVPIHHCYYLGQYPWYWDFTFIQARGPLGHAPIPTQTDAIRKFIASPAFKPAFYKYGPKFQQFGVWLGGGAWEYKKSVVTPFGMTETYPDLNFDLYKTRDEEENRFFLGDAIVDTWNEQRAVADIINARFKKCIDKMYPPPEKTVKTKDGEMKWPGKPLAEIQRPPPDAPYLMPPGVPVTKINAGITLSLSPSGRPEGLTLETYFY